MYISLFLNFPLAREVIGIFYLTFIPGLIFIKLLKLELDTLEFILFSVGFSVAFLMLSGLVINQFGSIVGFSFPLSTLPLSLFVNTLIHYRRRSSSPKTGKGTAKCAPSKP